YSSVATEIYQQIRLDLRSKLQLFPTAYLRAAALVHEANDFEQSSTVDAYDYAIELYSEAKRYFDVARLPYISRALACGALLWHLERRFAQTEAQSRLGYCRCLLYRYILSPLAGRPRTSIFEVPRELEKAREGLEVLFNRAQSLSPWKIRRIRTDPRSSESPG